MTTSDLTQVELLESNNDLAYEVVLAFFSDDAICLRYGITHTQLVDVKTSPAFMRLLQDATKQIAEDGDSFRLKAASYADDALKYFDQIAKDEDGSIGLRLRASEMLCKYAGREINVSAAVGQGMQIVLQTNLNMDKLSHESTYTVRAKIIEPPTIGELI